MEHLLDTERQKNNDNVTTLIEFQKQQQQLQVSQYP